MSSGHCRLDENTDFTATVAPRTFPPSGAKMIAEFVFFRSLLSVLFFCSSSSIAADELTLFVRCRTRFRNNDAAETKRRE
jgi:hypothetical protein